MRSSWHGTRHENALPREGYRGHCPRTRAPKSSQFVFSQDAIIRLIRVPDDILRFESTGMAKPDDLIASPPIFRLTVLRIGNRLSDIEAMAAPRRRYCVLLVRSRGFR